jgi:hypothetical protein
MQADKNHLYFLLRSSGLVIIFLLLWWFFLLNPLLYLLKGSVKIFGSIIYRNNIQQFLTETDSAEWELQILSKQDSEKLRLMPGSPKGAIPKSIILKCSDFYIFTFGIPVLWAIILATSGIRRSYRPIVLGTIFMIAVETALALAFAEIIASRFVAQNSGSWVGFSKWLNLLEYKVVVLAVPYAAPFVVAVALQRELRWQIFRWGHPAPQLQGDGQRSGSRKTDRPVATRTSRRRAKK